MFLQNRTVKLLNKQQKNLPVSIFNGIKTVKSDSVKIRQADPRQNLPHTCRHGQIVIIHEEQSYSDCSRCDYNRLSVFMKLF